MRHVFSTVAQKFLVNVPYRYVLGRTLQDPPISESSHVSFKSTVVCTVGLPGAEYVVFTLPENSCANANLAKILDFSVYFPMPIPSLPTAEFTASAFTCIEPPPTTEAS